MHLCIYTDIHAYMPPLVLQICIYAPIHAAADWAKPYSPKKTPTGAVAEALASFRDCRFALEVRPQKNLTPASKTMRAMRHPLFLFPRGMY